ncbi:hypothetical protein NQ176_g8902 [Zarea fungicola]|uniref:Uncharacterized protein n=1 Tax=Zarea fungicola TaxID=93591 RepID=A0ACC1MRL8_9HYPO|nr:hypothetical protein NQ176_g8902 [Lecanicillium fungicola]
MKKISLQADTPQDLVIDGDYVYQITLRRSLLAHHHHTAHGCTSYGHLAVCELCTHLFGSYLPRRYLSIFHLEEGATKLRNKATDSLYSTRPLADWEEALRILGGPISTARDRQGP